MEDQEIIGLFFARKESAIAETAVKYGRMLQSIAYRILRNHSDSEECENDTYSAAWNAIPPQNPKCLAAFLGRITRNIALDKHDYYTAEKRNREFEVTLSELGSMLTDQQSLERQMEAKDTARYISAFLNGKSYTKRVVFVRRYWYCDSISTIASDYGFSESKVKSLLMRMRNELKRYLERNGIPL